MGLRGLRVLRLKPIRILISGVIGNRLVPARDFFLEKKQKRARCSGLPSRFILCRTCRAKAACLGGVSVCIPHAAGAACSSRTVRHARTRLWPCACAHRGSSKGRDDGEAGGKCGGLRGCGGASAGWWASMAGVLRRWFRRARWRFAPAKGGDWRKVFGVVGIVACG